MRRPPLIIGFLLVVGAATLVFLPKKKSDPKVVALRVNPPKTAREVFEAAPTALAHKEAQKGIQAPEGCEDLWGRLSSDRLETLGRDLENGTLPLINECFTRSAKIVQLDAKFGNSCFAWLKKSSSANRIKDHKAFEDACSQFLLFYRAAVIRALSRGQAARSLDAATLMNSVMASFLTGDMSKEAFKERDELLDALIEKEPELYAAHKGKAVSLLMQTIDSNVPGARQAFDEALLRAEKFGVKDVELAEAALLPDLIADRDEKSLEMIKTLRENYSELGVADYYEAGIEWQRGHRQNTIGLLQSALTKEPSSTRYKETLDKIRRSPDRTKHLFTFNMSFGFKDI